jgi:hypothetical protein
MEIPVSPEMARCRCSCTEIADFVFSDPFRRKEWSGEMKIIANYSVSIFAKSAHSRRVWERVLTSILLLAGIAGGPLRAQQLPLATRPPAGPHRPAGVPSNYVITPFGYFHPSCVLQLNKGEHMDVGGMLHHADGSTAQVGPCQYPRYMPSGELVAAPSQTNNSVTEQDQGTPIQLSITHSWIENSEIFTSGGLGEEVSTWTVPPFPLINEGQDVAFFPGLQTAYGAGQDSILQPVIEYVGGVWYAASWNCCQSGTVWESTPIVVNPGDTMLGTTVMTCAAGTTNCRTWNVITEDQTTHQSTELSNTPTGYEIYFATGGALEVYYVNQCLDYPPNGSISINTLLYDSNFNQIANPGWSGALALPSSAQPQCNYGVATTATQTTLTYGTGGPSYGLGTAPEAGIAVNQGSSASGTLTIFDGPGFSGLVQLSVSSLPAGVTAQITQGSSSNTYILTLAATGSAVLTEANQPATLTLTATASGVPTYTFPVNVIVNPPLAGGAGTVVDLGNYFNVYGFFDDAQAYAIPHATSIDGAGDVYSANQLSPPGTSPMGLNVAGVQFEFGAPNGLNAVYGTGSNPISLPSGAFAGLELLGASANGVENSGWPVIVTYADGTTQTFLNTYFPDWDSNVDASCVECTVDQSVADVMPYCENVFQNLTCNRLFRLYRLHFPLDSSKTVQSVTLPNNRNIFVLAATLIKTTFIVPTVTVTPSASSITTNQGLTVTVTVSGGPGNPVPTGEISLGIVSGSYYGNHAALNGSSDSVTFNIPAGTLAAGSYTFTAGYEPDGYSTPTYHIASGFSTPVTVQGSQTITFANPGTQMVGTPLTLSATATSGLAVSFTSATTGICTVSGTTATFLATGTCSIDADQAGNSSYAAAPEIQQSFTVNGEAQTITFPTIAAQSVGTPLTLAATATSGLAVSFTSTTTSICTASGGTATFIASGTCTIDANQAGNSTYTAAPQVQQSFTVNIGSQTITFANPGTQTVGTPLTLSATATSGLAVTFTSSTASICTVSGATATFIASGTCTIDANQAGNSSYAPAPQVQQSFTVSGEAQTITFPTIPAQTVGTPLTLSATATSGLAVTFTSTTTGICTVSGTAATFIASGTCTIDANQAGNSTYAATMVPQSITVNPAPTFTGSGGGGTISIQPGATTGNTVTISVTPSNGFTGTVNLSCSISPTAASDPATCSFAPPSLTFTGATAQTSTLTIYTTAATIGANQRTHPFWPATGGTTLAVILLFGIPRKRHNWLVMLVLLVLFVSIGAVGCGGSSGGGGGGGGGGGNAGTTPGTYTVTVTGTSGFLTVPLGTVTLVVQ